MKTYTAEEMEMALEQFHSMMVEFLHAGREVIYKDICAAIGYTPIEINYHPDMTPEDKFMHDVDGPWNDQEPEHTLGVELT